MKRSLISIVLISLLYFSGCAPAEEKVTAAEAVKFAAEIETAAFKHKPYFLTSAIITAALVDRMKTVNSKIVSNSKSKTDLAEGLRKSGLEQNLYKLMGDKGSFEKVKIYEKAGMQRVIFRTFGEGFNYLDLELTKLDNKVGIADFFVYLTGENISESMAELVLKATDNAAEKMKLIKNLVLKGNYDQAKREFERMPLSVQQSRIGEALKLQILSNMDDALYEKEWRRSKRDRRDRPAHKCCCLTCTCFVKIMTRLYL